MSCADRRDNILLLVSGALDAAEEQELRAHLATGCPVCAGAMAEAQTLWSQIPMALTPVAPSSAAKELLMIKVDATAPEATRGPIPISQAPRPAAAPAKSKFSSAMYSGIAAAVAVAITYFTMNAIMNRKDETIEALNSRVQKGDVDIAALSRLAHDRLVQINDLSDRVRTADSVINLLKNPDTQIVKFGPAGTNPQPAARMLWSPKDNAGMFIASNMKPAAAGHCYELWLITGNQPADKLAAGMVIVDDKGDAVLPVIWKNAVAPKVFAITDEPNRPNITDPQGPATMVIEIN